MDVHCKHISFEPGDFVFLSTKHLPLEIPGPYKLKPLWVGPYKIVYTYGDNAYELELLTMLAKLLPVFNVTLLKLYVGDIVPAPDPIKLKNGSEYEVYAILHYWWVGWQHQYIEYLVSFVSYDTSHNE